MKPFAYLITTALFAGAAAADQYDGSQTSDEFAQTHFAQSHETGDGPRRSYAAGRATSVGIPAGSAAEMAALHFAADHETGDGPRSVMVVDGNIGVVISTSRQDLASLAQAKLDTDERGDN